MINRNNIGKISLFITSVSIFMLTNVRDREAKAGILQKASVGLRTGILRGNSANVTGIQSNGGGSGLISRVRGISSQNQGDGDGANQSSNPSILVGVTRGVNDVEKVGNKSESKLDEKQPLMSGLTSKLVGIRGGAASTVNIEPLRGDGEEGTSGVSGNNKMSNFRVVGLKEKLEKNIKATSDFDWDNAVTDSNGNKVASIIKDGVLRQAHMDKKGKVFKTLRFKFDKRGRLVLEEDQYNEQGAVSSGESMGVSPKKYIDEGKVLSTSFNEEIDKQDNNVSTRSMEFLADISIGDDEIDKKDNNATSRSMEFLADISIGDDEIDKKDNNATSRSMEFLADISIGDDEIDKKDNNLQINPVYIKDGNTNFVKNEEGVVTKKQTYLDTMKFNIKLEDSYEPQPYGGILKTSRIEKRYSKEDRKLIKQIITDYKKQLEILEEYDSQGKLTSKSEYDLEGKLTSTSSYDLQGKLTSKSEYDLQGKLTSKSSYDSQGKTTSKSSYDSQGKITSKSSYDSQGKLTLISEYDSEGKLISTSSYDSQGKLISKSTLAYDSQGKLISKSISSYDSQGKSISTSTSSYDSQGRLTSISEYDSQGRLISKSLIENEEVSVRSEESFDSGGNIKIIKDREKEPPVNNKESYKIDGVSEETEV